MTDPSPDPTQRFSDRVADYIRYRPSYPTAIFDILQREFGLVNDQVAADIGSGTGIFAELLLEQGLTIFAVEPNDAMREAAEAQHGNHERFTSVAAGAESTTLPDACAHWVFAAQAFHWFEVERCRAEFSRILKPAGHVVLIWNDRRLDSPFAQGYEQALLENGTDYTSVRHDVQENDRRIAALFAPKTPELRVFDNEQRFDLPGLKGRTFSASYTPPPGEPRGQVLAKTVEDLFHRHQSGGEVVMAYRTRVYVGSVSD